MAAGAERARQRALGEQGGEGVLVGDRLRRPRTPPSSSARPSSASVPWPGAGTKRAGSSTAPISASRPSRCRPARASTIASSSPLPRACAGGCRRCRAASRPRDPRARARSCAARRTLLVPTRAPAGDRPARVAAGLRDAAQDVLGRSARAARPAAPGPSASSPGTSLAECTARSISPASSASSIASTQRDLSVPGARPSPHRRRPIRRPDAGVAADRDRHDLRRPEQLRDEPRLGERERAAPRAEAHQRWRRRRSTRERSRLRTSASSLSASRATPARGRPRAARTARARAAGSRGCALSERLRRRIVGSCSSRFGDRPRDRLDAREVALARPTPSARRSRRAPARRSRCRARAAR